MINSQTIAVVVPAYNEESQIEKVVQNMPDFVDKIIVINDGSTDKTLDVVTKLIDSPQNKGLEISNKLNAINEPEEYNRAERVLLEKRKEELKFFPKSEVVNKNPESDRLILINLKKNSGVGAAVSRGYKWCLDYG